MEGEATIDLQHPPTIMVSLNVRKSSVGPQVGQNYEMFLVLYFWEQFWFNWGYLC